MSKQIQSTKDWLLACLIGFALAACSWDETVAVSYGAYNHTDESIVSIVINGEGGILNASAHGEGGGVCCVVLPKRWRQGLMATIKWQEDDIPIFNPDGTRQFIDGVPATKESPWKERTVEVPKYEGELGTFFIHIFPGDEVKVLVHKYAAGYEGHPFPHPDSDKSPKGK
ncbi:hypothetical protein AT959_08960 [Dechloromonas denitrificans]|uniref:DUF3304 domain-containing protein n=1 Tax=Dechloromonas denitrificans TaxID=281362 RepID=A0A133XIS7_9RHOO|nr:DUF3304 domain-containing protein [Dechloromonas denitrificans]KXB30842.1 hypothetical protein AT959_08960 [Dechloromonas denitrificans]